MVNHAPLTPAQCRGARALLDWSQDDLADAAELSRSTVKNFETGKEISSRFSRALRAALDGAGAILLDDGDTCGGATVKVGVALRREAGT